MRVPSTHEGHRAQGGGTPALSSSRGTLSAGWPAGATRRPARQVRSLRACLPAQRPRVKRPERGPPGSVPYRPAPHTSRPLPAARPAPDASTTASRPRPPRRPPPTGRDHTRPKAPGPHRPPHPADPRPAATPPHPPAPGPGSPCHRDPHANDPRPPTTGVIACRPPTVPLPSRLGTPLLQLGRRETYLAPRRCGIEQDAPTARAVRGGLRLLADVRLRHGHGGDPGRRRAPPPRLRLGVPGPGPRAPRDLVLRGPGAPPPSSNSELHVYGFVEAYHHQLLWDSRQTGGCTTRSPTCGTAKSCG